jgi:acyl-lipid omega-6 desaturase (Delta-12 desaturase)
VRTLSTPTPQRTRRWLQRRRGAGTGGAPEPTGVKAAVPSEQDAASAVTSTSRCALRSWPEIVRPYARANHRRAVAQLLNTGLPFLLLMAALIYGDRSHVWLTWPLVLPAVFLLVRLFIIQHDCGHGSFFASRRANDLLGRVIGLVTLTPYGFWRKIHALHHANSGNLDRRGDGDITTLTVREYRALSLWRRLLYRAYRHPLVLFGLGAVYFFVICNRIPTGNPLRHRKNWSSILGTNAALTAIIVLMVLTVGARAFMLAYLPVILLAASTGIWLFYVQHQFEHAYWASAPDWDFHEAAFKGSSFYDLPVALHWLTGHIGFHHIHHICTKIPNYSSTRIRSFAMPLVVSPFSIACDACGSRYGMRSGGFWCPSETFTDPSRGLEHSSVGGVSTRLNPSYILCPGEERAVPDRGGGPCLRRTVSAAPNCVFSEPYGASSPTGRMQHR